MLWCNACCLVCLVASLADAGRTAGPGPALSYVFSSRMVLQRGEHGAVVFGTVGKGERVTVALDGGAA